jgi:hypothetical protein
VSLAGIIFVGNPQEKRLLGRNRQNGKTNIKLGPKEIGYRPAGIMWFRTGMRGKLM